MSTTTKSIAGALVELYAFLIDRTGDPISFNETTPDKRIWMQEAIDAFESIDDDDEDYDWYADADELSHTPGFDKHVEVAQKFIKVYEGITDISPIEEHHLNTLKQGDNHKCACPPLEMKVVNNTPYCQKCRQLKLPL